MITQQNGLLATPASQIPPASAATSERERLRQELLKRIITQETRRQAARGPSR
jgi:hypothetical protein